MKRLNITLSFLIGFSLLSFAKPKGFEINCILTGFSDSTMFYLENMSSQEIIDSIMLINNKATFRGVLQDAPERLVLHAKVGNQLKYVDLFIGNERVSIQGDLNNLQWNAKILGSKTQNEKNDLQNLTQVFDIKRDSLTNVFMNLSKEMQKERRKEIWDQVRIIDESVKAIRIKYLWSHTNTYQGIILLGELKNSISKDTVQLLYDKLSSEIKSSKYAKVIEVYLKEKISSIGDMYHDFQAIDQLGSKVRLSDKLKNYILLDFTSSGCIPCIKSVKELEFIDKTFSDSLSIISISCDSKKENWLSSLKKDRVTWLSLWDGEGRYSKTFIKYGVSSLPSFFLIDSSGLIIDKWTGYDEGYLIKKLARFKKD